MLTLEPVTWKTVLATGTLVGNVTPDTDPDTLPGDVVDTNPTGPLM